MSLSSVASETSAAAELQHSHGRGGRTESQLHISTQGDSLVSGSRGCEGKRVPALYRMCIDTAHEQCNKYNVVVGGEAVKCL